MAHWPDAAAAAGGWRRVAGIRRKLALVRKPALRMRSSGCFTVAPLCTISVARRSTTVGAQFLVFPSRLEFCFRLPFVTRSECPLFLLEVSQPLVVALDLVSKHGVFQPSPLFIVLEAAHTVKAVEVDPSSVPDADSVHDEA